MQMILLCGGLGMRLRKVIGEKQKVMVRISGKPFLLRLVEYYKTLGIKDFIFATGYRDDEIIDFFGNGKRYGIKIKYSKETEPLGTGGAIRNAYEYIDDEKVFVANGDTMFNVDIKLLDKNMSYYNADMSILLKDEDDKKRYGEVLLDDENEYGGLLKSFIEKNIEKEGIKKIARTYINAGIYLMKKNIIREIEFRKLSLEYDIIPKWIEERKKISGIVGDSKFLDIGTEESLNRAKEDIR